MALPVHPPMKQQAGLKSIVLRDQWQLATLLPKDGHGGVPKAFSLIWHYVHSIISFTLLPLSLPFSSWVTESFDSFYLSTATRDWKGEPSTSWWNEESVELRREA